MSENKVYLVFPPTKYHRGIRDKLAVPPLGLMYLAASLKEDFEVKILDATLEGYYQEQKIDRDTIQYGLHYGEIKKRIADFSPDVVGVSCIFSSHFPTVREICRITKELSRDITTVIGGSHPTFLARECMADPNIDYVILGEGDHSFRELIRRLGKGKQVDDIDGIAFRKNGQTRVNPKTQYIQNLDEIPFPARDLLSLEKYFAIDIPHSITPLKRRNTTLITSRGCPQKCTFCPSTNFWGNRVRARSPENVLTELRHLKDTWGIDEIQFEDDNLTFDRRRSREIFRGMYDADLGLRWSTPNGVALWTLDEELLDLMKASGCYELTLGFESGCQEVLNTIIHKPYRVERSRSLVAHMKRLHLRTCGFFIIGFPGETKEQIYETLDFMKGLDLDKYHVFIFNPLPGSTLFTSLREQGLLPDQIDLQNMSFYKCDVQLSELSYSSLERIAVRELWGSRFRLAFHHPFTFLRRYRRGMGDRTKHRLRVYLEKFISAASLHSRRMFGRGG